MLMISMPTPWPILPARHLVSINNLRLGGSVMRICRKDVKDAKDAREVEGRKGSGRKRKEVEGRGRKRKEEEGRERERERDEPITPRPPGEGQG
jgi:hypothetical protein